MKIFANQFSLFKINHKFFSAKFRSKTDICYYKLFNLGPNASFDEIKKEYYKLAKKYHPDNKESSSANQTVRTNKFKIRKNLNKYQKPTRFYRTHKKGMNTIN